MAGTAEAFVGARTHNPSFELIGILLTGSGTQASMTRAAAREAINKDFGGQAPLFASFVRHAEAPASKARDRGLLAHELEQDEAQAAAAQPWWKLPGGKHGSGPQPRRAVWTTNSSGAGRRLPACRPASSSTASPLPSKHHGGRAVGMTRNLAQMFNLNPVADLPADDRPTDEAPAGTRHHSPRSRPDGHRPRL